MTISQLERDLTERVDGEVRFDPGTRGAYSTDASNFRQVPLGVVLPRTVSEDMPALYGHFGQGCVHTRIPFDLFSTEGVATYRRFMERAADLVASYGGSLSGEHGDGQSRGELLDRMFGDDLVRAFEELKAVFDPGNRMSPGKVTRPAKLDQHLRLGGHWAPAEPDQTYFRFPHDGGSFAQAASRCVGVGKCRQHEHSGGAVMCPSYQVTGEEEHSTRGRARRRSGCWKTPAGVRISRTDHCAAD